MEIVTNKKRKIQQEQRLFHTIKHWKIQWYVCVFRKMFCSF